ncbi:hypothetical protein NDU88_002609 [Pleurodeles waltl]|uniref:Uncharacterized protein n=1 Tax=Pleurodeles waltl TaxID=8319 RepID=A0AAV7SC66_PLEWA|nr:hypothetical protein NDU88_002609 [Pleurodeles waltl]
MDGGSRPPGLHPQGRAQGGAAQPVPPSPAARLQGSAAGARSRPPQGLSPFFQPAAHAISSAIGLATVQPGASQSPSCFPFPGSAWSPRGHKMQDLGFFLPCATPARPRVTGRLEAPPGLAGAALAQGVAEYAGRTCVGRRVVPPVGRGEQTGAGAL